MRAIIEALSQGKVEVQDKKATGTRQKNEHKSAVKWEDRGRERAGQPGPEDDEGTQMQIGTPRYAALRAEEEEKNHQHRGCQRR